MHDVVAIEIVLASCQRVYALTWGRIHHETDPGLLEAVATSYARRRFADVTSVRVCDSLSEVAGQPHFFECFFEMAQQRIPYGDDYDAWRDEIAQQMVEGREFWLLA